MKCMWDENNLYVLMNVKDSLLSTAAGEAHMQDSVEVFVDENNGKTTYYEDDDAQYRVNCENVQSFGTGAVAGRIQHGGHKNDGRLPCRDGCAVQDTAHRNRDNRL